MKRTILSVTLFLFLVLFVSTVSASRLPTVGGDSDNWGTILNDYLTKLAGENATLLNGTMVNGTNIYSSSINTTHILNGTIIDADISDTTNLTLGEKITFTLGEIIDNIVDGWITITGGLNVTGNITSDWATFNNLNVTGISYLGSMNLAGGNITATLGTFETLNVTGTSYLGDTTINAQNITTNNLNVTGISYLGDATINADNIIINATGDVCITGGNCLSGASGGSKGYGMAQITGTTIASTGYFDIDTAGLVEDGTYVDINPSTNAFTLKGGRVYKITSSVYPYNYTSSDGKIGWHLVTSGGTTLIGTMAYVNNYNLPYNLGFNQNSMAIVSPSSDTTYQIYIWTVSNAPNVMSDRSYVLIEEI